MRVGFGGFLRARLSSFGWLDARSGPGLTPGASAHALAGGPLRELGPAGRGVARISLGLVRAVGMKFRDTNFLQLLVIHSS